MAFRSVPRPSSPPGAKASTECPSFARYYLSPTEEVGPNLPRTGAIHMIEVDRAMNVYGLRPSTIARSTLG